jgi:hypothetical protein
MRLRPSLDVAVGIDREPPFCSAVPSAISPDGCVQIRTIWRPAN